MKRQDQWMRSFAASTAAIMFVQTAIATPGALASASGYDLIGGGVTPPPPIKRGGPNTLLPMPSVLSIPYTYNSNGTVDTIADEESNETTFGYDSYGNTTSITDPLNHTTTYVYSCCRITSRTDARNRTTTYSYDAWGRRTGIDYPTSTDQSFQYDVERRMTQAVDGTGTRTYTYDALGRKTYQTDPRGNTTATYDAASRLLSQTDVTGRLIEYDYDPNGGWSWSKIRVLGRRMNTTHAGG